MTTSVSANANAGVDTNGHIVSGVDNLKAVSDSSLLLTDARARLMDEAKVDVRIGGNDTARKEIARSFVSDTITVPTPEMYAYAAQASLGDDVYHEPSTAALERHVAQLTGKEAGLFLASGTMSNQIALRTHLAQPPYSVLCDQRAHIHNYEAGGAAFHSGAAVVPVLPANGHHLTLSDVKKNIVLENDIHFAPTKIVALENTLNGTIFPQEDIVEISKFAHENNVKMHLDGARIWHVAAETGTPLRVLCEPFDSVSLCFSKGLGAPVGSCLVGTKEFISKARWFRKLFGGGMRQTGILAGAAAYALTYNFPQLPRVHELARRLQDGLQEIGVGILSAAETCMIFFDPTPVGVTYEEISERASQLDPPLKLSGSRIVIHVQTSDEAVNDLISVVRKLAEEKRAAGFVFTPPEAAGTGGQGYRNVYYRVARKTH